MEISLAQIRAYRLASHHLEEKRFPSALLEVVGAVAMQNSPPGAWETALWNRLEGVSLAFLRDALYRDKTLLQAWSFRGVPAVFPTEDRDVFLSALLARPGEEPWIYTRGIGLALDYLQMDFDALLPILRKAAEVLDTRTVKSKEELDRLLAKTAEGDIPPEKLPLWRAPSMYGSPDRQTVGGAVASFLLRPCAFSSLVVFGERRGSSPTFTSMKNWLGREPEPSSAGEKELSRRFLRCYGPATAEAFANWLGCSPAQGRRLWAGIAEEMEPVTVEGKTRCILAADRDNLLHAKGDVNRLLLLGAHDPYLDLRDKASVLPDKARQQKVWRTTANPGAVVKGGRVIGIWKGKTGKDKLDISVTLWEALKGREEAALKLLAEEFATFRQLELRTCALETNTL